MRASLKTLAAIGGLVAVLAPVLAPVLALALTLGACTALPKPFQRADAPPDVLARAKGGAGVRVALLEGTTEPMAKLIAQSVAKALADRDIPASVGLDGKLRYALVGKVLAGGGANPTTPTRIEWRLLDRGDEPFFAFNHDVQGSAWEWEWGSPKIIQQIGVDAAKLIAEAVVPPDKTLVAVAAPTSGVWVRPIEGAPGDGDTSLTRAMRFALMGASVAVTSDQAAARHILEGKVRLGNPEGKSQPVEIVWTVNYPDGGTVGRAVQRNMVPVGTFDGRWGETASIIAASTTSWGTGPASDPLLDHRRRRHSRRQERARPRRGDRARAPQRRYAETADRCAARCRQAGVAAAGTVARTGTAEILRCRRSAGQLMRIECDFGLVFGEIFVTGCYIFPGREPTVGSPGFRAAGCRETLKFMIAGEATPDRPAGRRLPGRVSPLRALLALSVIALAACATESPSATARTAMESASAAPLAQSTNVIYVMPVEGLENPLRLVLSDAVAAALRDTERPAILADTANNQGPTIIPSIENVRERGSVVWVTTLWKLRAPYGTVVSPNASARWSSTRNSGSANPSRPSI